ncbi:MAG: hypothetical protein HZA35_00800 [Parcubacteria group bacterium]|nr:hypothetical protein [Parcubacteria group bacterium]
MISFLGWVLSLLVTGMLLPLLRRLLLLRDGEEGFLKSPSWVYVPSVLMWVLFAKQNFNEWGIAAATLGFVIGLWMWRVSEK